MKNRMTEIQEDIPHIGKADTCNTSSTELKPHDAEEIATRNLNYLNYAFQKSRSSVGIKLIDKKPTKKNGQPIN